MNNFKFIQKEIFISESELNINLFTLGNNFCDIVKWKEINGLKYA